MQYLVATLTPWGVAILLAVVVMALEAWLTRPDPMGFLASLRQPAWALPMWAMMVVPFAFYGAAIVAGTAMLRAGEAGRGPFELIAAVLLGNAVFNHILYRRRRLDWAFRYEIALAAVAAWAAYAVLGVDWTAGILMGLAFAFVLYDVFWARALARLNPDHAGPV